MHRRSLLCACLFVCRMTLLSTGHQHNVDAHSPRESSLVNVSAFQARQNVAGQPATRSRRLQQASAPAVAVPPYTAELSQLLPQLGPGRPITYKNVEAAYFVSYAQAGATVPGCAPLLMLACRLICCICRIDRLWHACLSGNHDCLQFRWCSRRAMNMHLAHIPYNMNFSIDGALRDAVPSVIQPLTAGSVLLAWQNDTGAVILAFPVSAF